MAENKKYSIKEFLENPSTNSTWCFNFYDWFCKDSALEKKAIGLAKKVKFLVEHGVLNDTKTYAWFKNNCPINGVTYDDIRISTMNDGDYYGGFCPKTGHANVDYPMEVFLLNNSSKHSTVVDIDHQIEQVEFHQMKYYRFKNWADFKKAIKMCPDFHAELKKHFNK